MKPRTVLVRGTAIRAAIVGVLVARRCAGPECRVIIEPLSDPHAEQDILIRPDWQRFHDEIGLSDEALTAATAAQAVFATSFPGIEERVPFSPFGKSKGGAEFHHYWLRANRIADQPALTQFSAAIALGGRDLSPAQAEAHGLDFGLSVKRESYARLLLGHASSLGAEVVPGSGDTADLVIDCTEQEEQVIWQGQHLQIGASPKVPGLEFQVLYNVGKRFVSLAADWQDCAPEQHEFNRLSAAELERVADFAEALTLTDLNKATRPALRRKVALFQACGRIPREDYEVIAPHEWLALFWAKGLRPRRYDRLADAMPADALLEWVAEMRSDIQAMATS